MILAGKALPASSRSRAARRRSLERFHSNSSDATCRRPRRVRSSSNQTQCTAGAALPVVLVPQRRQSHNDQPPSLHRPKVEAFVGLDSGDLVVDMGCNDGTLFDGYQTEGLRFLGFDPSDVSGTRVEKGYEVELSFFSWDAFSRRRPDQRAKVVTASRCSTTWNTPARLSKTSRCLAEDGIWGSNCITCC